MALEAVYLNLVLPQTGAAGAGTRRAWASESLALQFKQPFGRQRQHLGDRLLEQFGDEIARLEGVVLVGRVDRPLDREGQPLDLVALEAEMRFAEARGEPRAEDLQLAMLPREPELDAVPVEPRGAVAFAGGDRGDARARRYAASSRQNRGARASGCGRTCRGSSPALRDNRAARACG